MPPPKKLAILISYIALVVVLLLAFGFTLVYTLGDQLTLAVPIVT